MPNTSKSCRQPPDLNINNDQVVSDTTSSREDNDFRPSRPSSCRLHSDLGPLRRMQRIFNEDLAPTTLPNQTTKEGKPKEATRKHCRSVVAYMIRNGHVTLAPSLLGPSPGITTQIPRPQTLLLENQSEQNLQSTEHDDDSPIVVPGGTAAYKY